MLTNFDNIKKQKFISYADYFLCDLLDLLANNYTIKLFTFKKDEVKVKPFFSWLEKYHDGVTGWSLTDSNNHYVLAVFSKPHPFNNSCQFEEFLLLLRIIPTDNIIFYYTKPHLFGTLIGTFFGNSTTLFPRSWVLLSEDKIQEIKPKHMFYNSYESTPFTGKPILLENKVYELNNNTKELLIKYFEVSENNIDIY